eukprot:4289309-Heterocapsa_arctica.AAC.1
MAQAPVAAGLDVVVGEDVPVGCGLALASPSGQARYHAVDVDDNVVQDPLVAPALHDLLDELLGVRSRGIGARP